MDDPAGAARARPTLYVMVGLPGAGKTTHARRLETERRVLRLTPDEWMIPLFADSEAEGKRDVLEGRFVWLTSRALRIGTSVVLDFGVWGRDERSALRWVAAEAGADCELVYLPVGEAEQRGRVRGRFSSAPGTTFPVSHDDLDRFRLLFEEPDEDELAASGLDPPPAGFPTWTAWLADRWPTSVT